MTIHEWVNSSSFEGFEDAMLDKVGTLSGDNQELFLRKLIESYRLQQCALTPNMLKRIQQGKIDISLYIVIESILLYKQFSRFPYDNELYAILRQFDAKNKSEAMDLWEKVCKSPLFTACCAKDAVEHEKPFVLTRTTKSALIRAFINKDYSAELQIDVTGIDRASLQTITETLKEFIPTRKYDSVRKVFTIPPESYTNLIGFLMRWNCVLDFSKFNTNTAKGIFTFVHKAPYKQMFFCEGVKSKTPHPLLKASYHWCGGRARFGCAGICRHEAYQQYTIFDMLNILQLTITDQQMSFFYGILNWFNLYLEHLFCYECDSMLEPATERLYRNAHRTTYFRCPNNVCQKHSETIYLNHCFTEKCNSVIDSRTAARCPNGFVICQKCGVCCSYQQFARKSPTGALLGNRSSQLLAENNNRLHLERREFYCPKCGLKLQPARLYNSSNNLGTDDTLIYVCNNSACENYRLYGGIFPLTTAFSKNNQIKYILNTIQQQWNNPYTLEIESNNEI